MQLDFEQITTTSFSIQISENKIRKVSHADRTRDLKGKGVEILPFLARGVPDLSLDALMVHHECSSLELDADGGFGVQAELVSRVTREYLRFPDSGVSDQD